MAASVSCIHMLLYAASLPMFVELAIFGFIANGNYKSVNESVNEPMAL